MDVATASAAHAIDIIVETDTVILREGTEGLLMESYADALRERLPDQIVILARTPKQEHELVIGTRVVAGITIDEDLLDRVDRLELFAYTFTGANHVLMDAFTDYGAAITNAGGVHTPGIVEQAAGNMFVFVRRLHRGWRHKGRAERRYFQSGEFTDSTVMVIGLGSIGQVITQRLQGFEVETIGIHYTPPRGGSTDGVAGFGSDTTHDAFSRSNYVVVACPLNNLTRRLIRDAEFATTSTNVVLVNAARGGIVDTGALTPALWSNKIRGVVLDVTGPEPFPADHPLWGLENCLIMPHMGGHMLKHWNHPADIVAENLGRLDEDEELENQALAAESN